MGCADASLAFGLVAFVVAFVMALEEEEESSAIMVFVDEASLALVDGTSLALVDGTSIAVVDAVSIALLVGEV